MITSRNGVHFHKSLSFQQTHMHTHTSTHGGITYNVYKVGISKVDSDLLLPGTVSTFESTTDP